MNTFSALVSFTFISLCTCTPYGYRLALPYSPAPLTFSPAPLIHSAPAPLPVELPAPTYKSESYSTSDLSRSELRDDSGQYSISYVTSNGIRVSERGYLKPSAQGYISVKEGTYEYTSPDGTPVSYGYKADENGFNIKGFPLPLGPVQS